VTCITAKINNPGQNDRMNESGPVFVRAWSADEFHHRVLELEAQGYTSRRETYRITPETNPETGDVSHLHVMELLPPQTRE
jgi:hypothetical protein